jgi:hypothetical protein
VPEARATNDETKRKLLYQPGMVTASEKTPKQTALELTTDDHLAASVNAVNLEDRLSNIEADCRYRLHGSLL